MEAIKCPQCPESELDVVIDGAQLQLMPTLGADGKMRLDKADAGAIHLDDKAKFHFRCLDCGYTAELSSEKEEELGLSDACITLSCSW